MPWRRWAGTNNREALVRFYQEQARTVVQYHVAGYSEAVDLLGKAGVAFISIQRRAAFWSDESIEEAIVEAICLVEMQRSTRRICKVPGQ